MLTLVAVFTGCGAASVETFDYKKAYEELSQTVIEQGYQIDDIAGRFSEDELCVCFGDSILGLPGVSESYAGVIEEKTGLETVNAGFGGASIAKNPNEAYDAFSLYRLVDAVVSGDWSLQDANIESLPLPSSAARYEELKSVDWSKVSVVTLGMGMHDINDGYAIEDLSDPRSTNTVKGALRYSIEKLIKAYPHIRVMVLTPTYRFMLNSGKGCNEILYNGNTFDQYIDAIIGVAKEYKLPYVDLYRTMGISAVNYKYYYLPDEGTHFNSKGNDILGRRIANELLLYFG